MSAVFRAELANLQRLVAADAAARAAAEAEAAEAREAQRQRNALNAAKSKTRIATRQAVLDFMRRQKTPVTYYRVAKHTGISPSSAQKHLRELAEEGTADAIPVGHGRCEYVLAGNAKAVGLDAAGGQSHTSDGLATGQLRRMKWRT